MGETPHCLSIDEAFGNLQAVPKPCKVAQQQEQQSRKVLLSDVFSTLKRKLFTPRAWARTDLQYGGFMLVIHALCLLAPFTFSWPMFTLFVVGYGITGCLGITLSFHRQLSHRSFVTPKWLEYALAYCGVLAVQGDPIEWASSHRYHHLHTDTPLDPHSPYEGFWWSHMGWLLDNEVRCTACSLAHAGMLIGMTWPWLNAPLAGTMQMKGPASSPLSYWCLWQPCLPDGTALPAGGCGDTP